MKRFFAVLPLLVLLVLPAPAFAKVSDSYIGGKISYSAISPEATLNIDGAGSVDYEEDDYSSAGIGLVYGFTLKKMDKANLRLELEAMIRFGGNVMEYTDVGGTTSLEIHTNSSLLAGLYLDFPITDKLSPYVGALIGVSIFGYEQKMPIIGGTHEQTGAGIAFQYGIGGGVSYKVSPRMGLDLGVRYLLSTDANIDDDGTNYNTDWDTDVNNNILDVSLGFRYYF